MGFTGVLFDLDNTLFDHRGAANRAVRAWIEALGLDGPIESHVDRWFMLETRHHERFQRGEISHQDHRRARMRDFLPGAARLGDKAADEVFAGYLDLYRAAWRAFDDAAPAVAAAQEAGLAVGILTNGEQAIQDNKVRRTGLGRFKVPVFASSALAAAKPSPAAFHHACTALGIDPSRTLMVGDSLAHDVRGALGAGLDAVLLDRRGRSRAAVRRVRSLAELAW